jgi:hypothetical protein
MGQTETRVWTVVDFVGSTCLHRPVSVLGHWDRMPYPPYRYKLAQARTVFPYMEKSQMFGKIVLNP